MAALRAGGPSGRTCGGEVRAVKRAIPKKPKNKFGKVGVFFAPEKVVAKAPRSLHITPHIDHKNTTTKTRLFAKTPSKNACPPQNKKSGKINAAK
jgi:hypothetical protein